MILAPRSWPSRPGFAITTRIVPGTSAEYRGAPERHRLLSGLAEPRQPALGLHARGRRQPRLARLRPRSPGPPAGDVALARGRRDRHHALPPRPLGRPRAVGLGHLLSRVRCPRPETEALGPARRRRVPRLARGAARLPGHVRAYVPFERVRARHPVPGREARRHANACPALPPRDVRLPRAVERRRAHVLRRLGALAGARRG